MSGLEGVDPGVQRTVEWLQAQGFTTVDSGDGHSKREANPALSQDDALTYPHVYMVVDPSFLVQEADRLAALLTARGVRLREMGAPSYARGPEIQASYDPVNKITVLTLLDVDDQVLFPQS